LINQYILDIMLIEFNVSNYRSFAEEQAFSTVAAQLTEEKRNSFLSGIIKIPNILQSCVIYGANASGKSNFVKALDFMRDMVLDSAKESSEGDEIETVSFLLKSEQRGQPSTFEVVFIREEVRYQYGFSATKERVTHEWLFAYPEGRTQRWFEREYNPETNEENWYLNSVQLKGKLQNIRERTRKNVLFLSKAVDDNYDKLKPVYLWFKETLKVLTSNDIFPGYSIDACKDEEKKKKIIQLLKAADIGIKDITLIRKPFSEHELPKGMPQEMKEDIAKKFKGKEVLERIDFIHETESGENLPISLDDESDGTQKLFALAIPFIEIFENGSTVVIDELNNSLHPHIVRFLVEQFHNPDVNKNNAQLIFTTHDTTLLDSDVLRRDQVWFMEKDNAQSTQLYPLLNFSPRKNEALGKGYLNGRYGALPFVGELGWE